MQVRKARIGAAGAAALAACGVLGMAAPAAQADSGAAAATWTKQVPAAHPSARFGPAMTYDAATSTAVLFGGGAPQADTWTWG